MIIYKITNKINKKIYIGQTRLSIEARFILHKNKKSNCVYLKSAFKKYGIENFTIEEVEHCETIDSLNMREEFWIKELNTLAPNGYNLTTGGAAPKHSDTTKEKMSATRKGKHPHWATEASRGEVSRARRAASHTGKVRPDEVKAKIKEKLIAQRGKKIVDQNGVMYNSISDAAVRLNLSRANIQLQLRGLRKQVGDYSFKVTQ